MCSWNTVKSSSPNENVQYRQVGNLTTKEFMMATAEAKVEKKYKVKASEETILASLFTMVEKPNDIIKMSCLNVYGNCYRINIWTSLHHPFIPNYGKITSSYFVKENNGSITIVASN